MKEAATDSKVQGPGSWGLTHLTGLEADEDKTGKTHELFLLLIKVLSKRFKANECREAFVKFAEANPVKRGYAFDWSVRAHNAVNGRNGKQELTNEQAYEIWGPDNIRIAPCSGEGTNTGYSTSYKSHHDRHHREETQPVKGNNPTYIRSVEHGQQPGYYGSTPSPTTHFGPLALSHSISSYFTATRR